jgi:hypothetical protein
MVRIRTAEALELPHSLSPVVAATLPADSVEHMPAQRVLVSKPRMLELAGVEQADALHDPLRGLVRHRREMTMPSTSWNPRSNAAVAASLA